MTDLVELTGHPCALDVAMRYLRNTVAGTGRRERPQRRERAEQNPACTLDVSCLKGAAGTVLGTVGTRSPRIIRVASPRSAGVAPRRCRSAASRTRASPSRSASRSAASSASSCHDACSARRLSSSGSTACPRTLPRGSGQTGGMSPFAAISSRSGAAAQAVGIPRETAPSRIGCRYLRAWRRNSSVACGIACRRIGSYRPASASRSSARWTLECLTPSLRASERSVHSSSMDERARSTRTSADWTTSRPSVPRTDTRYKAPPCALPKPCSASG